MKWKSHLRIAEWVGSSLDFSKENIVKLAEGSIAPDKWRDHSHHHNHEYLDKTIRVRILKARKLFLKDSPKYFFETGVVLHYIADRLIPIVSYSAHLNIEEEIAKMSVPKKEKKYSPSVKKHMDKIKEALQDLEIGDEEKTLLLDPNWTEGKVNTLKLALTDLPEHTGSELLFHIAYRISIGVASSIISRAPPPQLLWEKFKYASDSISRAISKLKFYLILEVGLPLLLMACGRIGVLGYFLIILLNLLSIIPIIAILRKRYPVRNYLNLKTHSKTLFVFFLLASLSAFIAGIFNSGFLLAGGFLALIALLHLFHPKVPIPEEVEEEIDWYNWEEESQ